MNVRCRFIKMNNSVEHSEMWITLLKTFCILFQSFGCSFGNIRAAGSIVLIANLKYDLVKFLFLSAVPDMVVIIFNNPVLSFLLGIVFYESFIKQLMIYCFYILTDDCNVVGNSTLVNIFCNKSAVVMIKVALTDNTADTSFFDKQFSFLNKLAFAFVTFCESNAKTLLTFISVPYITIKSVIAAVVPTALPIRQYCLNKEYELKIAVPSVPTTILRTLCRAKKHSVAHGSAHRKRRYFRFGTAGTSLMIFISVYCGMSCLYLCTLLQISVKNGILSFHCTVNHSCDNSASAIR